MSAHLGIAVGVDEARYPSDERLWHWEDRLDLAVEASRRLARHLDVGQVVVADRDEFGARQKNVGDLHHRVDVDRDRNRSAWGRRIVGELDRRHFGPQGRVTVEHADRTVPGQLHGQLGVLRDQAFDGEAASLRIEPGGQPVEHHVPDGAADAGKVPAWSETCQSAMRKKQLCSCCKGSQLSMAPA